MPIFLYFQAEAKIAKASKIFMKNRHLTNSIIRSTDYLPFIRTGRIGRYPIQFILPEFVSYLGERGVLCVGNG